MNVTVYDTYSSHCGAKCHIKRMTLTFVYFGKVILRDLA